MFVDFLLWSFPLLKSYADSDLRKQLRDRIMEELSQETNSKAQCESLKRIIKLASCFDSLRNYNGLMEVLTSVFSPQFISKEYEKVWEVWIHSHFSVVSLTHSPKLTV